MWKNLGVPDRNKLLLLPALLVLSLVLPIALISRKNHSVEDHAITRKPNHSHVRNHDLNSTTQHNIILQNNDTAADHGVVREHARSPDQSHDLNKTAHHILQNNHSTIDSSISSKDDHSAERKHDLNNTSHHHILRMNHTTIDEDHATMQNRDLNRTDHRVVQKDYSTANHTIVQKSDRSPGQNHSLNKTAHHILQKNHSTVKIKPWKPDPKAHREYFLNKPAHHILRENHSSADLNHVPNKTAEHFTLCNRKIFVENFPRRNNDRSEFGIAHWNRSLSSPIIIRNLGRIYGNTGNQIFAFFHAFDMARDKGAALVIHDNGYPFDKPLNELFLGLGKNDAGMKQRVESLFGVRILDDELKNELNVSEAELKERKYQVKAKQLFWYRKEQTNRTIEQKKEHRQYLIQNLYQLMAKEMKLHPDSNATNDLCSSLHAIFCKDGHGLAFEDSPQDGLNKSVTQRYTVIHRRDTGGMLDKASEVMGLDARAPVDLPPELIMSIVNPLGMNTSSILMIHDDKDSERVVKLLSSHPVIGPLFQVVPHSIGTKFSDMMLAILSDVFIGNPSSTFSWYIAMVRYALGFRHTYLFYRWNEEEGRWETFCDEDCLYDPLSFHSG